MKLVRRKTRQNSLEVILNLSDKWKQELYLSTFYTLGNMTNKKNDEVVEVDGAKGETPENVVVHVSKDGAAKIEKLKKTLS